MAKHDSTIERLYSTLQTQLTEDGIGEETDVMKTARLVGEALHKDGFSITLESNEDEVRAFQVVSKIDASVVSALFQAIPGWKTKTLELKGATFVVVGTESAFSIENIKKAITSRVRPSSQV